MSHDGCISIFYFITCKYDKMVVHQYPTQHFHGKNKSNIKICKYYLIQNILMNFNGISSCWNHSKINHKIGYSFKSCWRMIFYISHIKISIFEKPNLKIILRHQAKYRANQDKQTNMDSSKILYWDKCTWKEL